MIMSAVWAHTPNSVRIGAVGPRRQMGEKYNAQIPIFILLFLHDLLTSSGEHIFGSVAQSQSFLH